LALSVCVFTHEPPQFVVGDVQVDVHEPALQACVAEQVVPHFPQLLGSVCSFTQTPLHDAVPLGHTQAPALHVWPVGHVLPHAPQLEPREDNQRR
jgi:hypothetical protein